MPRRLGNGDIKREHDLWHRKVIYVLNWELKACARCGGDLFIDRDTDGWFEQCLQCSHRRELMEVNTQLMPVDFKQAQREDWSKHKVR